jgi:hypothetical protein
MSYLIQVYEWQNNWGSGLSTKEFAQIHELDKTITHYATDESASAKSSPAVSLYDLNTREDDFKKVRKIRKNIFHLFLSLIFLDFMYH